VLLSELFQENNRPCGVEHRLDDCQVPGCSVSGYIACQVSRVAFEVVQGFSGEGMTVRRWIWKVGRCTATWIWLIHMQRASLSFSALPHTTFDDGRYIENYASPGRLFASTTAYTHRISRKCSRCSRRQRAMHSSPFCHLWTIQRTATCLRPNGQCTHRRELGRRILWAKRRLRTPSTERP